MAVTTADGLVMGADSMTLIRDGMRSKTFMNATKVFELENLPLVAMTYGVGAIGRRSIGSLIEEWSAGREAYEKTGYTVRAVAESLSEFIFSRHRAHRELIRQDVEQQQLEALADKGRTPLGGAPPEFNPSEWMTGIVVGGYQPGSHYPFLYSMEEPARSGFQEGLLLVREHEGDDGCDGPASGVNYWGATLPLERLFRGYDPTLLSMMGAIVQPGLITAIPDILSRFEWDVLCEGMPLPDAADLAKFMLETGVKMERFRDGTPLIGGELDIAIVMRSKIHWFERKEMSRAMASLRALRAEPGERGAGIRDAEPKSSDSDI